MQTSNALWTRVLELYPYSWAKKIILAFPHDGRPLKILTLFGWSIANCEWCSCRGSNVNRHEFKQAWHAAVYGTAKSWTWLSNWTTTNAILWKYSFCVNRLYFGMSSLYRIFNFLLEILCFKIVYLILHFIIWKWIMESTKHKLIKQSWIHQKTQEVSYHLIQENNQKKSNEKP